MYTKFGSAFILFFALHMLAVTSAYSYQEVVISGSVVDSQTEEALIGVNVVVKGTTIGTSTDVDGNFTLSVPSLEETLVFSYIGFERQEVYINGKTILNIILKPQAFAGDELVVVGYGIQQKSDLTGSVSSVSRDRFDNSVVPTINLFDALKGAVPGLQISQSSTSARGGNQSILIRGRNSINASNSPLIILDGSPYEGAIASIPTNDIDNVSVLKGPSATAIYGSRGANGVILISTRQGGGGLSVTYNGSVQTQTAINIPDLLTPQEFFDFKQVRTPDALTASEREVMANNAGVNWVDLALQDGVRNSHSLSFSGGNENLNFFISGSALNATGISVGDKYDRYTLRPNLTVKVNNWLTLTSNSQLMYGIADGLDSDYGSDRGAFYMNPLSTPYDENGDINIYPWPEGRFFTNPLGNTTANNSDRRSQIVTNNSLKVNIPYVKGLEYTLQTSVMYRMETESTYWFRNSSRQGAESNGRAANNESTENDYSVDNILKYNKDFGKHNILLTGLFGYQSNKRTSVRLDGEGFPNDVLTNYQYSQAELLSASTNYTLATQLSSMLRVNYNFDSKYLITATVRRDGYNGFGDDNKYGVFPSIALGWNIANEDFFNLDLFNSLKLRASHGTAGNQAIGVYETLAQFRDRNYLFGNSLAPGYIPSQLPNPSLSWESTTTTNIGVDFSLLKDRISGTIDVYNSKTNDLLLYRSIPNVLGFTGITQNIGNTQNQGVELTVTSFNINEADFSWSSQVAVSYNRNEILSLIGNEDILSDRLFIGQPIDVNYGYVFDGVWQLDDDIANSAQPDAEPGFVKIRDVNGDGAITSDDRAIQGQRDPKYLFSISNTVSYKNFSVYAFIQGQSGSKRFNPLSRDDVYTETQRNTTKKNWWTPDNPTNEHWANNEDANQLGLYKLESDAFLRLKNVTLSYSISQEWLWKSGISQLKLNVTGENLLTITEWTGLDPELGSQRSVPLTRNLLFGVTLSF